jgi:hypothetical protein
MHLPRRVRRWWSRHCTDLCPIGTPTLHGVASLHMVILAIPANRHPRLSPHWLPWHGSPRPCMVFVTLPGSSLPTLSTTAKLPQVTYMACSKRCRSSQEPYDNLGIQLTPPSCRWVCQNLHLRPSQLRHQRHRLVLDYNFSSTPITMDYTGTDLFASLRIATALEPFSSLFDMAQGS